MFFIPLVMLAAAAHAQQVYRCGNQYSSEPCGGGKVVDVSPAVRSPDAAGSAQVFLCVSNSGSRFWSSEHCRERGAQIDRIESVPAGLPWDQQVQIADQQTRQGYAIQRKNMEQRGGATAGTTGRDPARCAHFNQQVDYYDRLARRPQSSVSQGWVAERRKEIRDQQFRSGC
ncbi:hypothetical protein QTH91_04675 [Variovorax dokdonensis]|uniref:DUF4124 domain-containing protein n=1 Tax=Variovorax dokdonensis TaxID=344883 RepID=A0ABT7N740_9BURK|nr:hypothetical protein [Variovorax dokdonensis]MDM0043769.1 hypothetical protein [Variovorax dokdonensis]